MKALGRREKNIKFEAISVGAAEAGVQRSCIGLGNEKAMEVFKQESHDQAHVT